MAKYWGKNPPLSIQFSSLVKGNQMGRKGKRIEKNVVSPALRHSKRQGKVG